VDERLHRAFPPTPLPGGAVPQHAGNTIMTIREDIGFDDDPLADDAFGGKPAAVDARPHRFDHDPPPAVRRRRHVPPPSMPGCLKTTTASGGTVIVSE